MNLKILTSQWTIMRGLRAGAGLAAIIAGAVSRDYFLVPAGIFVLVSALLNTGCCGSGSCPVPMEKQKKAAATKNKM